MFFLLYKHTDDGVLIFDHFPKIFEGQTNIPEDFPKISEDCRGVSRKTLRYFYDTPMLKYNLRDKLNLISVKSLISTHVRISYIYM